MPVGEDSAVATPPRRLQRFPEGASFIVCEIKWVRVRGRSKFHAIALTPDGTESLIAESPSFRWRLPLSPDATPSAVEAHEALTRQLETAGWQTYGTGSVVKWYAERFRILADEPSDIPTAAPTRICEVRWVRTKRRSEFQAVVRSPGSEAILVARSPSFRWGLPVSPDATPSAAAAHEALCRELLANGWGPCTDGGGLLHWYAVRFRSPTA